MSNTKSTLYKLITFVPDSHVEAVKAALFAAGAGRLGNYADCCWQVLGQGQFRPLAGNQAYIGNTDELTHVPEWRVEVLIAAEHVRASIHALQTAHPYETPAFEVIALVDLADFAEAKNT